MGISSVCWADQDLALKLEKRGNSFYSKGKVENVNGKHQESLGFYLSALRHYQEAIQEFGVVFEAKKTQDLADQINKLSRQIGNLEQKILEKYYQIGIFLSELPSEEGSTNNLRRAEVHLSEAYRMLHPSITGEIGKALTKVGAVNLQNLSSRLVTVLSSLVNVIDRKIVTQSGSANVPKLKSIREDYRYKLGLHLHELGDLSQNQALSKRHKVKMSDYENSIVARLTESYKFYKQALDIGEYVKDSNYKRKILKNLKDLEEVHSLKLALLVLDKQTGENRFTAPNETIDRLAGSLGLMSPMIPLLSDSAIDLFLRYLIDSTREKLKFADSSIKKTQLLKLLRTVHVLSRRLHKFDSKSVIAAIKEIDVELGRMAKQVEEEVITGSSLRLDSINRKTERLKSQIAENGAGECLLTLHREKVDVLGKIGQTYENSKEALDLILENTQKDSRVFSEKAGDAYEALAQLKEDSLKNYHLAIEAYQKAEEHIADEEPVAEDEEGRRLEEIVKKTQLTQILKKIMQCYRDINVIHLEGNNLPEFEKTNELLSVFREETAIIDKEIRILTRPEKSSKPVLLHELIEAAEEDETEEKWLPKP